MPGETPPTFTLSFEQTRPMQQPLVYVRRRLSDGKALYIGSSVDGLSRPLGKAHEKAHVAEGEVLEVYLTDDPRELEARMILEERPELNYNGPNSSPHSSVSAALRCAVCERPLLNRHGRAIFCSGVCRDTAREAPKRVKALQGELWGLRYRLEQEAARPPVERALRTLLGRVEEAVEDAREALAERESG